MVIDAILGIGMERPLAATWNDALARMRNAARFMIAVDVPTGVDSDVGTVPPWLCNASVDLTLALGAVKPAHLLQPSAARCGVVRLVDLGLVPQSVDVRVAGRPTLPEPGPQSAQDAQPQPEDIVVTGVRASLKGAQQIKRNAAQVVDSIVAEDIGKLPDNTVSDALQRVTGIQVSRAAGEVGTVLVRGLPDIETLINGREIFTGTGRGCQQRGGGAALRSGDRSARRARAASRRGA